MIIEGTDYEKIEHPKYKYRLLRDMTVKTEILPIEHIFTEFLALYENGFLEIGKGYAWDGATYAIDTPSIMESSLPHDALCQLVNMDLLPKDSRKKADKLFRKMCREDGMPWYRVLWTYHAVVGYRRFKHKFFIS